MAVKTKAIPGHHVLAYRYRCPSCNGRGGVESGRVRVAHKDGCEIWTRLVLTRPAFLETLDRYRNPLY